MCRWSAQAYGTMQCCVPSAGCVLCCCPFCWAPSTPLGLAPLSGTRCQVFGLSVVCQHATLRRQCGQYVQRARNGFSGQMAEHELEGLCKIFCNDWLSPIGGASNINRGTKSGVGHEADTPAKLVCKSRKVANPEKVAMGGQVWSAGAGDSI